MMVMMMVMVMIVMVVRGPVIMVMIMMVIVMMAGFSDFSGFPEGHRFGGLSTAAGVTHVALPQFSNQVQKMFSPR